MALNDLATATPLILNGLPQAWARVKVQDSTGAMQDLSDLAGQGKDMLLSVEVDRDLEQSSDQATVTVARESYFDSLAPLVTSRISALAGGQPLIRTGALFTVEIAVVAAGSSYPAEDFWREYFRGYIDNPDSGSDPMTFTGRDQMGELGDVFIEIEKTYGSSPGGTAMETVIQQILDDAYSNQRVWSNGITVTQWTRIRPSNAHYNGYWYRASAITTGTTGGAEPTWPTTVGNTVVDSGVTWKCMGKIPQLYTPVSPSFPILAYLQKQESVLTALKAIVVNTIGWDIRYKWDSGTSAFRLTLYQPPRASGSVVFTWNSNLYTQIPRLTLDGVDIRNRIQVVYGDVGDLDPTGLPKRKTVTVEDQTSQTTYSRGLAKFMQVAEGSSSLIRTLTDATNLANAALSDLKDPTAEQEMDLTCCFPFGELNDRYTFTANQRHYTSDQTLAVVKLTHKIERDKSMTTLVCRGKPTAGKTVWLKLDARPGISQPAYFQGPVAPTNVAATKVQGGVAVTFTAPALDAAHLWESHDLHVSKTNGFTPDASTFKANTRSTRFELGDLDPGTTYYAVVIPRDHQLNQGTASSQVTIAAGYTTPGHMQPQVATSILPPNADFEAWNDSALPPDTWTMITGTWATDAHSETTTVLTGARSLKLDNTSVATKVASQLMVVQAFGDYLALANVYLVNRTVGSDDIIMRLNFFSDFGVTSVGHYDTPGGIFTSTWSRQGVVGTAPAGAIYARIEIFKNAANAFAGYVDSCMVAQNFLVEENFVNATLQNAWASFGGARATPGYSLDPMGFYILRGALASGASGTTAFTLPAGPPYTAKFPTDDNGSFAYIVIDSSGHVTPHCPTGTEVSLDGIRVPTF